MREDCRGFPGQQGIWASFAVRLPHSCDRTMTEQSDIQQRLIRALGNPARYPHPADSVECIETHISWVLLAGEYAYKLKKPLDLGFLDFSTLERRRFFCEEELRINRRLAPHLYQAVVAFCGDPDAPVFDGRGRAI
jgi:uncharacterized protein